MFSLKEIKRKAKGIDTTAFRSLKIAVLGDHSTQFFSDALSYNLIINGFSSKIFESDYNQIDLTILDNDSELYKLNPSFIIFVQSTLTLQEEFLALAESDRICFHNKKLQQNINRLERIKMQLPDAKIISFTYQEIPDNVYGSLFTKNKTSFLHQVTELNYKLFELAKKKEDFFLLNINSYLSSQDQNRNWRIYISSEVHYSLDAYTKLAYHASQLISASAGKMKKCLILDLDNTLWGGIIGDDGIDGIQLAPFGLGKAFLQLQKWAKELKDRGVIIAICSKNEETTAKQPFEHHPNMILRLEDIAIFVANWNNKADNIRYIKNILNIGYDSMVFLDDNPMERNIVRENLPEICVPELPPDPALYMPYLNELNLFETNVISYNDRDRTRQYQEEAERKKTVPLYTNMNDYLSSLEMEAEITPFKNSDIPRIAQLTQRSNQFNLRTIRYNESDILKIKNSEDYLTYTVKLKDKFGAYGLISVVILEKKSNISYFIDTWLMSCRVLKRGVENLLMNHLVDELLNIGATELSGEYIETPKNSPVSMLLPDLGLKKVKGNFYALILNDFQKANHFIKINNSLKQ